MFMFVGVTILLVSCVHAGSIRRQVAEEYHILNAAAQRPENIVDGVETTIEMLPYKVSIRYTWQNGDYDYLCDGAIISDKWVLTAAHCITNPNKPYLYKIRTGTSTWKINDSTHRVTRIIRHENYHVNDVNVQVNDIAALRIGVPFELGPSRKPVQLFDEGEKIPAGSLAIADWIRSKIDGAARQPANIVNGDKTTIEMHPYQVSIAYDWEDGVYDLICSGAIISDKWVLTAAHCITNPNKPYLYKIRAGSSSWKINGSTHRVTRIIRHENYHINDDNVQVNDIAVLRIGPPFELGPSRKRVQLFDEGEKIPTGSLATVSGWGRIGYKQPISDNLRVVTVPIIDLEECSEKYYENDLVPGEICAGYTEDRGTEQGDSGGPLIINNRLAGIVSWSDESGTVPDVYTEIAYYRDWICKKTGI